MAKEYGSTNLPSVGGGFTDTEHFSTWQKSSWLILLDDMEKLLQECVYTTGRPAWAFSNDNIVISFWPRNSGISRKFQASAAQSISNCGNTNNSTT